MIYDLFQTIMNDIYDIMNDINDNMKDINDIMKWQKGHNIIKDSFA